MSAVPRVSVVIPAYNEPGFLAEALAGVAAQTFADFEVIVIDDGSPRDLTSALDAAAGLGDRLRFVRQDNAGGGAARNHGIELAQGEWVAFLDHDDRWLAEKLARQMEVVDRHRDAGMVFCQYHSFGGEGDDAPFPSSAPATVGMADLLRSTLIRTLSVVLVRRDVLIEVGMFRTDLSTANDLELYHRIAERHPIRFLAEDLVAKRRHESNASADRVAGDEEGLQIIDELSSRLGDGVDRETRQLLRARAYRHLVRLAAAAGRRGERQVARSHYRRAIGLRPTRARALFGWLGSFMP